MIVAHHGWGEEVLVLAAGGGGGALSALVLAWRLRLGSLRSRLRPGRR